MIHKENVFRFLMMTTLCVWFVLTCLSVCGLFSALNVFQVGLGWFVFINAIHKYVKETFINPFSRLLYVLATGLGLGTSIVASILFGPIVLKLASALMVIPWLYIFGLFMIEYDKYEDRGCGLMPKGADDSPTVDQWKPGMVLVSEGLGPSENRLAFRHGEIILWNYDENCLMTFSNYMEYGCRFYQADEVYDRFVNRNKERFWLLEPVVPLTEAQLRQLWQEAKAMHTANVRLRVDQNKALKVELTKLFAKLTKQEKLKFKSFVAETKEENEELEAKSVAFVNAEVEKQMKKRYSTGYYWMGLWVGVESKRPEWTCISCVLVLLHRVGMKTARHALGLFGLGTGTLDPIIPVNFVTDIKHFRLKMRPGYQPEPLKQYSLAQTIWKGFTGWPLMVAGAMKPIQAIRERMMNPAPPLVIPYNMDEEYEL